MPSSWARASVLVWLACLTIVTATQAADSLYGKVTAVRSADVVVFNYGPGEYVLRIIGIVTPSGAGAQARAADARGFLTRLVLNKNVRMRLERRDPKSGEMWVRLFTDDKVTGVKDVGLEMVRAGVVRREASSDTKYGEMAAAENEARTARRGLWAQSQPQ